MTLISLKQEQRVGLETLIALHKVVFRTQPSYEIVTDQRVCVGFDLELLAQHLSRESDILPGCGRCCALWAQLATIAEAIRPSEGRPSRYDVQGFDRSLHTTGSEKHDDVSLVVEIRHRDDPLRAVDACEESCLREMTRALRELGAQEHEWNELAASARRAHVAGPA